MNKLLIVGLLAAAGVLGWLVLSKPVPPTPVATETKAEARAQAQTPKAGVSTSTSLGATPGFSSTSGGQGAATGAAGRAALSPSAGGPPHLQAGAYARDLWAPGSPAPVVGDPLKKSPWGRDPSKGMAEAQTADVKRTLRRYWGNLPKSGAVPASIAIEELLSPAVIKELNVPPQSVVTMLGDHRIDAPESFKAVLEKSDTLQTLVGITIVTPDGSEIRDYVRMNPPPK